MKKRDIHYLIEVGRGKGSYKTRFTSTTLGRAQLYYNSLNIGLGYKKRLRLVWEVWAYDVAGSFNENHYRWFPDSITLASYLS